MAEDVKGGTYPTAWQRKTMWAALTALFFVLLVGLLGTAVWLFTSAISFLQPILIPVAIAVILSYLLDPLVTRLTGRGFGRTTTISMLFLIAFLALVALIVWVAPVISMQTAAATRELPAYTQQARDKIVDVIYRYDRTFGVVGGAKGKSPATSFVNWLLGPAASGVRSSPTPVPTENQAGPPMEVIEPAAPKFSSAERQRIQEWVEKQIPNLQQQLPYWMEKFWSLLTKSIGGFLGFTGFLLSLLLVPIYLFFLLKEGPAIRNRWKEYLPLRSSPIKDEVAAVLVQINSYVIAYFRGQLMVCLIDGILIALALSFFGLNFALVIGCLVVVLTMIPYIGIIICWIPAVLIAAAQWGDWTHPLLVTAIFVIVQNLEGLFIAPRIVGNSVGLHPMTVIVSIFVWGLLIGGLLGPILAVPLTATIKVLLARYVWGTRLREQMIEEVEEIPVVQEAHSVAKA